MATFDDVVRLTAHLPEVEVTTSYGTPALAVRHRSFCRLWGPRDRHRAEVGDAQVLVVFCDPDEKAFLLEENDGIVFSAPHYDGHPNVLVLLDEVDEGLLANLLFDSYLAKAPPAIARRIGTGGPPG